MTDLQNDIKEILDNVTNLVNEAKFFDVITVLPTEIHYLKNIVKYLNVREYSIHLQLWLYVLLKNPFDITKILQKSEIDEVLYFLAKNINKYNDLDKYNMKTIALCMCHNNAKKDEQEQSYINQNNIDSIKFCQQNENNNVTYLQSCFDFEKFGFTQTTKHRIIYEMTKIGKHTFDIKFSEKDSIATTRYKIKTLSYQKFSQDNLNKILRFIDSENTKIGWTLSKSIVRMLKDIDYTGFVIKLQIMLYNYKKQNGNINNSLDYNNDNKTNYTNTNVYNNVTILEGTKMCKNMQNMIYCRKIYNENLWINATIILAMLTLNKTNGSDTFNNKNLQFYREIISSMIFYTNKTSNKAEFVRQTGLFLFWVCIRSNKTIFSKETSILYLVLVSLADSSLTCRRAASTVLFEFYGRYEVKDSNMMTNLINFHTVKRMENNIITMAKILNIYVYLRQPVVNELYKKMKTHNVFTDGKVYAEMIMQELECFCTQKIEKTEEYDCNTIFTFDNSAYDTLCLLYLIIAKENINKCKKCRESKFYVTLEQVEIQKYENNKYFTVIIEAYVDAIFCISKKVTVSDTNNSKNKCIVENIIFLMNKNLYTSKTPQIAIKYLTKDLLYTNFMKKTNCNYILANVSNTKYFEQVCKKYTNILEGNDIAKKVSVISALSNMKAEMNANNTKDDIRYSFFSFTEQQINNMIDNIKENTYTNKCISYEYKDIYEKLIYSAFKGLEDYSVDYKGDVGSAVRLEALKLLCNYKTTRIENYLIRYLVDKCVRLRKETLKIMDRISLSDSLQEFHNQYKETYTKKINNNTNKNDSKTKNEIRPNNDNQKCNFSSQVECLHEGIHFCTILQSFEKINKNYLQDFCIGYFCTFKNCDSSLFKILHTKSNEKMIEIAFEFFEKEKRYLLLSAYFLYEMHKLDKSGRIKQKMYEIVKHNKSKKYGNRVREMIEGILESEREI